MRALDGIGGLDGAGGGGGGGGGTITSVNGDVGPAVVLDAADVGADPVGTASAASGAVVSRPRIANFRSPSTLNRRALSGGVIAGSSQSVSA